jgi:hypothetical protein
MDDTGKQPPGAVDLGRFTRLWLMPDKLPFRFFVDILLTASRSGAAMACGLQLS